MVSPQNFVLDRRIYNDQLYSQLREFWFANIPKDAKIPEYSLLQRWFGVGQSDEQKTDFDEQCRTRFAPALSSIGPESYKLPEFKGYDEELKNTDIIASPLLREVTEAQAEDKQKASETLLSLMLLLDQMPRNIYRDPTGLKLVYQHYDRIAFSLLHSSLKLSPNPVQHESYRYHPAYQPWFLMPLMHSEHAKSHELYLDTVKGWQSEEKAAGNTESAVYYTRSLESENSHLDIIRRFGRYPHRNEALGRTSSEAEKEFLKTGETFGVKQSSQGKDEL